MKHKNFNTTDDVYKSTNIPLLNQHQKNSTGKCWDDLIEASQSINNETCNKKTDTLSMTFPNPAWEENIYVWFVYDQKIVYNHTQG